MIFLIFSKVLVFSEPVTYIYTYISREISIEQPSVGLASLAQLVRR